MERIGFIGLGIMGRPMALNLRKAGYELAVFDIDRRATAALISAGAEEASSPAEAAGRSDITITMLPNSPHVREAVLGSGGVLEGAKPGHLLVDMSSIDPGVSRELAKTLAASGISMLDAPVSGGEPKAVDGTLAIMVGGEAGDFERVRPILAAMGSSITHVGGIGSGNVAKLANQMIVALNIAAVGEAMVLARKAGVDPAKVFEAIRGGLAGSTVLEAKMPKILKGDFKPGFRIDLHVKDLQNALDTAHAFDVPVPLSSQALEILHALRNAGEGQDDHCGIIRFYERLARVEVRSTAQG